MIPNKMMKQHMREMSNMITKLKIVGYNLMDAQQVQAIVRSLFDS